MLLEKGSTKTSYKNRTSHFILLFFGILLSLTLLSPNISFPASLSVPLDDWKYEAIERITLALKIKYPINSRPMSRSEMAWIVKKALELKDTGEKEGSHYLDRLIMLLKEDLQDAIEQIDTPETDSKINTMTSMTIEGVYNDGKITRENNFGDNMVNGWHARFIPEWGFETGLFSGDLAPKVWIDDHGDERVNFLRSYLKIEGGIIGAEIGRDSFWWGPGRRGAWIITNNAQPFEIMRIYNPVPYSLRILGEIKFNMIYGRTSETWINYKVDGVEEKVFKKPHFGGMRLDFSPSVYLELGVSMAAHFWGRDHLSLDDIKEVFFPRHKAVNREETIGPVTDRVASFDITLNIPSPFQALKGIKIYTEYGGTDLSFVDRLYPRLTDVATLYGLYLDTGTTDVRFEYAQNLDGDDTLWYTHGAFSKGYTHKGDIIGHYIGGAARDIYMKITHPMGEKWRILVDYEHLLKKERYGNIPGRKNGVGLAVNYFKGQDQMEIAYEYENEESLEIREDSHLLCLKWKREY